jgi:eukaryotic-like serine/threonine-protein kinase
VTDLAAGADALPAPGAARGPVRYGRYVLIDRLGVGGMAEVFRAVALGAEQFQRVVVVKRILPHLSENPAFIKMFIDEATLCGRLAHPNIIQVHEFGKEQGQFFIAMEYLHGRNLTHILGSLADSQESMPVAIAAEIMRQACRGLHYAHNLKAPDGKPLGIIHRDITPGNVIVAYSGSVKVVDFGVARVENRFRRGTTDPGLVKGKSAYLAPEQLSPNAVDHRADIFAAGIVLHEMLTGRRLFKADSSLESMELVKAMIIPRPSELRPDVPAGLDAIVMRALARKRAERYQTAGELADALEAFLIEQRFSSQELLGFMHNWFAEESQNHRMLLSPDLLVPSLTSELPPADAGAGSGGSAGSARGSAPGSQGSLLSQWPALELDEQVTPAGGRGKRILLAGGALGLTLAALLAVLAGRPNARHVDTPPARMAAAPARAPVPVPPSPSPSPTPSPSVTISISSEPTGASVFEAGEQEPLGETPLQITTTRGPTPITFRIAKAGYVEGQLTLVPDSDRPALVTLAKSSSARRRHNTKQDRVRNAVPIDPFGP